MPQNYEECLDETITPVEFLKETGDKDEVSRIRTYLGSMKYTADEMNHPIGDLSGGQRAKLLLLQMSMSGSEVLILDEPTRNFSPLSSPVIRQMLKGFGGVIMFFVMYLFSIYLLLYFYYNITRAKVQKKS